MRIPLHAGSRLPLVTLPEDAILLAGPPPLDHLADVRAAVGEALRYPLTGPALHAITRRGGRATVVVQPPALPLPRTDGDPRQDALAAVLDELTRHGVARERLTVLVAGGLGRRAGRNELELLLRPDRARDFRGRVVVHDCEAENLRPLTVDGRVHRVHPALVETDVVVTVGASETVLHGGAGALVDACAAGTIRAAGAVSLLEATTSSGWRLAARLEAALQASVPVLGLALVLDHPRTGGLYRGYPWDADARRGLARSPFRRLLNASPASVRRGALARVTRELRAITVLAGPPSVAHAEALVRGVAVRSAQVAAPLDTLVVPLPWEGPRGSLDPLSATALGLGHVLRLWRDRPPLESGGTVVLLHPFSRVPGPTARALVAALRDEGGRPRRMEAQAARDRRALAAYRAGTSGHPRLPFAEWDACAAMLERAGRVIVAGCRDAAAARALGLVPSHNAATALEMARGIAGEGGTTGVILGPPYPPLRVSDPREADGAGG